MAWIESHTVVARHRKTLALARALGVEVVTAVGHIHCLWHSALEQQEDGDLNGWSDAMIAELSLWKGDSAQFVVALQDNGFLDGRLLHDWLDYAGRYLTNKYRSANPQRLKEIYKIHSVRLKSDSSRTKDRPIGRTLVSPPNLDNLPNQDNQTIPKGPAEKPPASSPRLFELWNQECKSLPKVLEMTPKRKDKERLRIGERDPNAWRAVFRRIEKSSFCRGQNERGWKATYDWAMENAENSVKVLEGKYDDPAPKTASSAQGGLSLEQVREINQMVKDANRSMGHADSK